MRVVPIACCLLSVTISFAQEAKQDQQPKIVCSAPLAVSPGKEIKLSLRGRFLDEVTAVKVALPEIAVDIASKGKVAVPQNYDAQRVGDSQVEIKFTLPLETPAGKFAVIATSPKGESPAYEIIIAPADGLLNEKEPNDGFKSAQVVSMCKTIVGTIHDPRNVDVFRLEIAAGQKLTAEVIAVRAGSLLDPILTLYDSKGHVVSSNDDHPGTRDSRIETTLSQAGSYFVSVQDANDSGGPHFVYLLKLVP